MSPWLSDAFLAAQSDQRLVHLARAGNEAAFAAIVRRYRSELVAHARRVGSPERAEDIVQQSLLGAFLALQRGSEVRHLRGWLHQIVRHTAARTRLPLHDTLDDVSLEGAPLEDIVQLRTDASETLSQVGYLPRRQRDALVGIALQGRAQAEVAATMGLSEGAVRQLVHRARCTLRAAATALTPYPLARALASSVRGGNPGGLEASLAAGGASVGGITLKVAALLASGVVAASGVATVELVHPSGRSPQPTAGPGGPASSTLASTGLPAGTGAAATSGRGSAGPTARGLAPTPASAGGGSGSHARASRGSRSLGGAPAPPAPARSGAVSVSLDGSSRSGSDGGGGGSSGGSGSGSGSDGGGSGTSDGMNSISGGSGGSDGSSGSGASASPTSTGSGSDGSGTSGGSDGSGINLSSGSNLSSGTSGSSDGSSGSGDSLTSGSSGPH